MKYYPELISIYKIDGWVGIINAEVSEFRLQSTSTTHLH